MKIVVLFALLLGLAGSLRAEEAPNLSKGQHLYLPAYSHVWHGDRDKKGVPQKTLVSVLVSIRNTDLTRSIRVTSARYYDTQGKLLAEYVTPPRTIAPLGTQELYVERKESVGGSGANFVIVWQAESPVNPPIVEAVHADIQGHRTLSFITAARPISPD
jgi:hypothetical protein